MWRMNKIKKLKLNLIHWYISYIDTSNTLIISYIDTSNGDTLIKSNQYDWQVPPVCLAVWAQLDLQAMMVCPGLRVPRDLVGSQVLKEKLGPEDLNEWKVTPESLDPMETLVFRDHQDQQVMW